MKVHEKLGNGSLNNMYIVTGMELGTMATLINVAKVALKGEGLLNMGRESRLLLNLHAEALAADIEKALLGGDDD